MHFFGTDLVARMFRVLLCVSVLTILGGCREKLPYSVGGTPLPDLADNPARVAQAQPGPEGPTDTITFEGAKPALYDKYVDWLTKKGWSRLSETQQVTFIQSIMVKDNRRLTLTYSPSSGLSISGAQPGSSTSSTTPAPAAASGSR